MTKEEAKDVFNYFRLDAYRDGDYFLEEEYYELEDILKRSTIAQELDNARYLAIIGKISEEEYQELSWKRYDEMREVLRRSEDKNKVKEM